MNANFPRILTFLRKERGISQKEAAASLKISQALLSHYEKGIRECGLDFVVRTADFYGVSCDYLLGRTTDKSGAMITIGDLPETPDGQNGTSAEEALLILRKKLILNSVTLLFNLMQACGSQEISNLLTNFFNMSVYLVFRGLYTADSKNPVSLFSVPRHLYSSAAISDMAVSAAKAAHLYKSLYASMGKNNMPALTPDELSKKYPLLSSSLLNLIKNTEEKLNEKL